MQLKGHSIKHNYAKGDRPKSRKIRSAWNLLPFEDVVLASGVVAVQADVCDSVLQGIELTFLKGSYDG